MQNPSLIEEGKAEPVPLMLLFQLETGDPHLLMRHLYSFWIRARRTKGWHPGVYKQRV